MKNRRNFYRLLQIQSDASPEVIRASYRALMVQLKQHPDLGGSTEQAFFLNEAYRVLSDPTLRSAYDRTLRNRSGKDERNRRPTIPTLCPNCKISKRKAAPGETCPACARPLQPGKPASRDIAHERTRNRIARNEEITFYSTWPGTPQIAKMADVSPEGMRFLCSAKLAANMVLKICCSLFEASATIAHVHEQIIGGERVSVVGVRFLTVNFKDSRGSFLSTSV